MDRPVDLNDGAGDPITVDADFVKFVGSKGPGTGRSVLGFKDATMMDVTGEQEYIRDLVVGGRA